jgi:hypothetical protein
MDPVGEKDGLLRLVVFLSAQVNTRIGQPPAKNKEQEQRDEGDVALVAVKRHWRWRNKAFFLVCQPFEIIIDEV